MTAKEYLGQVRHAERRIAALKARKIKYQELAAQRTAHYRQGPGGSTRRVSSVEDYACRIVDLEREMDRRIGEYVDLIHEIERAIWAVPDDQQREVLEYRYLNGWSWNRIAGTMAHTERHVYRLHGIALRQIKVPPKCQ
ncbi:MAG: hypothetical protein J6Q14_01310 [Oscillospiraceae bacterium]|nr:hypothetical protein [Oscillospiraceae bacterium]